MEVQVHQSMTSLLGARPKENQEELSAHPRQEKESISTLSFPELSGRSPLLEKAWG